MDKKKVLGYILVGVGTAVLTVFQQIRMDAVTRSEVRRCMAEEQDKESQ